MYDYGTGLSMSGSGYGLRMPSTDPWGSTLLTSSSTPPASVPSTASPSFLGRLGLGAQVFGAVSGAIGSFYSARSQMSALRFQAEMAQINARMMERTAQSALDQGQKQIGQLTLRAGQVKSAQRVALAANGVDLGVGNAAEIQASTEIMKEIDKNTLELNALRAAWGYRTQATSMVNEALVKRATADSISPFGAAAGSLLGSASGVASSWYQLNKAGAFNSPSNG
jgi:hypothetical protein